MHTKGKGKGKGKPDQRSGELLPDGWKSLRKRRISWGLSGNLAFFLPLTPSSELKKMMQDKEE